MAVFVNSYEPGSLRGTRVGDHFLSPHGANGFSTNIGQYDLFDTSGQGWVAGVGRRGGSQGPGLPRTATIQTGLIKLIKYH